MPEILVAILVSVLTLIAGYLVSRFLKLPKATDLKADPKIEVNSSEYVLRRYNDSIQYYWNAGRISKNSYKRFRSLTIILSSLITLISSLSSAEFVLMNDSLRSIFAIVVPIMAATLTIFIGLAQNFQWGATWKDMVVNAKKLESARDRFLSTPLEQRDYQAELAKMNNIILEETQSFFQRILDSEVTPRNLEKE